MQCSASRNAPTRSLWRAAPRSSTRAQACGRGRGTPLGNGTTCPSSARSSASDRLLLPSTIMPRVARSKEIKISLYASTAVTLVLGFADLVRGGTTASAFLLAIAYCVLIPLTIWGATVEPEMASDVDDRPSY